MRDILAEIGTSSNTRVFWDRIARLIGRIIPFDHTLLLFDGKNSAGEALTTGFRNGRSDFRCLTSFPGRTRAVDEYNAYYWKLQPIAPLHSDPVLAISWKRWNGWEETEYYRDFVRPNGVGFSLVPFIDVRFSLTIQRSPAGPPFSETEQVTMEYVSRHLSNIYSYLQKIEQMTQSAFQRLAEIPDSAPITKREKEIVLLLQLRMTYAEIASVLGISRRTVEKHVYNMYDKLGVYDKKGLLRKIYGQDPSSSR
ncbi:MAG: hypothetical protein Kow009_05610 [Spirochaetales bacterium]